MKEQSLYFSDANTDWGRTPLPPEICGQSDSLGFKNADFDQYLLIISQP